MRVSETETVIKRILPYLERRGYDIQKDLNFEALSTSTGGMTRGYIDILVTCGRSKPQFLIEAKRAAKTLTVKDRDQALEYGRSVKVPLVAVTNGTDFQCFNTNIGEPILWNGKLIQKIPTKEQLNSVLALLRQNKNLTSIPLAGDTSLPFRPGLPLKQLNELFKRCHNTIRKIEKNEEHAFADFSKFLFLKLLEEKADIEGNDLTIYSYRFWLMFRMSTGGQEQR